MKIIVKPATALPQMLIYKNVAAYCRVSTLQEIQHHSLLAQQDYYERLIRSRPGWVFVGIYADQASGRHNLKMRNFQRLMDDCRSGKIDLILVKSISRMGRNTVQFLQACTELNQLGVDVYFEVEKLYIHDPKAVRLLTIYGNINPQEQSIEKNRAIKELLVLMGRNRDKLCASMTAEQQEVLEKYDDCINEMHSLIEVEIFAYAFRLGGRLMLATLSDSTSGSP